MFSCTHAPTSLYFLSFGHGLMGHLYSTTVMLTNPASLSCCSYRSTLFMGAPNWMEASRKRWSHRLMAQSGGREPSSHRSGLEGSCSSTHPPGLRCLFWEIGKWLEGG